MSLEGCPASVKWFRKAQRMQNLFSSAPENQIKQFPFPKIKILMLKNKSKKLINKNTYGDNYYVTLDQEVEDPYAVAKCE